MIRSDTTLAKHMANRVNPQSHSEEELKNVKKAATEPPQLLLSQAMQDLLPESLGTFHQEKLKAEATIAMTQLYHE